jgi:hypothetical protein
MTESPQGVILRRPVIELRGPWRDLLASQTPWHFTTRLDAPDDRQTGLAGWPRWVGPEWTQGRCSARRS